jgi:hypothetical protein
MVEDGVDKLLRRYPESPIIQDVLGTLDAREIRARVHELEPEMEEIFCFAASVGALFGVRRCDGSRVAIKVNKLFTDEQYFAEVQDLQTRLADAGYPAPRPVRRIGMAVDGRIAGVHRRVRRGARRTVRQRRAGRHPRRVRLPPGVRCHHAVGGDARETDLDDLAQALL